MTLHPTTGRTELVIVKNSQRDMAIECLRIDSEKINTNLLIFLHEGLGSVAMWKDWPARLCVAAHCRGLVFSRYGYGQSTQRPENEKWPITYMHDQARTALPALLDALNLTEERPILYGHSDGGSIALLYAAMHPDKVKAVIVAAPHICVEDITISGIQKARNAYFKTDLPEKLRRYHQNPDSGFWGWNDVWLNPGFRAWNIESHLSAIRCPVLAIQGEDDEYGSMEQIHGIKRLAGQTELCAIPNCGHSPHSDQPDIVIDAVSRFIAELD
jgi:pimeloyl-ACP methyl ester carboxylesterase